MPDETNEHVSAWVDGELDRTATKRLLTGLEEDPEIRVRWHRYHLIGTALRRGLPDRFDPGMADEIRAAVAAIEPEPGAGLVEAAPTRPAWLKPLAGLAVAASVAFVAVLGVQALNPAGSPAPTARQVAVAPAVAPQPRALPAAAPAIKPVNTELDQQRLANYLRRHNEFVSSRSMQGVLPYVRVVTQDDPGPPRR